MEEAEGFIAPFLITKRDSSVQHQIQYVHTHILATVRTLHGANRFSDIPERSKHDLQADHNARKYLKNSDSCSVRWFVVWAGIGRFGIWRRYCKCVRNVLEPRNPRETCLLHECNAAVS